jgi:hypothetical protein
MLNAPHMTQDITSAMQLLYGKRIRVTSDLLKGIKPEELKSIFRQKAFELHPDRALVLGKSPEEMSEKFKDVKLAYEILREVLGNSLEGLPIASDQRPTPTNDTHPNQPAGPRRKRQSAPGPPRDKHKQQQQKQHQWIHEPGTHYWEADIPDTRLLFGQFLYYAGLIPWNNLISAITWQRRQRPSFGKIAKMWDYLNDDEIRKIIATRTAGEKLGESALRQGYLSHYQRSAVIGFQKWLQRPIGEFFQEIGILEEEEIVYLLKLLRKHNSRVVWNRW